jgi:trehalose 2-sulfotransferase
MHSFKKLPWVSIEGGRKGPVLVGTDTGYEGKFDFPRRTQAPTLTYLLATVPRTGSSWFSHVLWQTGCLGAPLEYLNFENAGPYYFAAKSAPAQRQLWQSLVARRTSPNGVFALKCFPTQLEALKQGNPQLLSEIMAMFVTGVPNPRVIYLERTDDTAHAISYARATLSGVWRQEQEGEKGTEVAYSEAAIQQARDGLDLQISAWEQMFRDLRIEPLRLSYEAILADPEAAACLVAQFLGVRLDPAARIQVPLVRKQSGKDNQAWAERFNRS